MYVYIVYRKTQSSNNVRVAWAKHVRVMLVRYCEVNWREGDGGGRRAIDMAVYRGRKRVYEAEFDLLPLRVMRNYLYWEPLWFFLCIEEYANLNREYKTGRLRPIPKSHLHIYTWYRALNSQCV